MLGPYIMLWWLYRSIEQHQHVLHNRLHSWTYDVRLAQETLSTTGTATAWIRSATTRPTGDLLIRHAPDASVWWTTILWRIRSLISTILLMQSTQLNRTWNGKLQILTSLRNTYSLTLLDPYPSKPCLNSTVNRNLSLKWHTLLGRRPWGILLLPDPWQILS